MTKHLVHRVIVGFVVTTALAATLLSSAKPLRGFASKETAVAATDADLTTILGRLKARYINNDFSHGHEYLSAETTQGSWPDINYNDRSVAWDCQKHLDRLAVMAVAYENTKSPDHGASAMLQGVVRGLTFWYNRKPQSDSWWSNEIGQQLALEQILVLLSDALPRDVLLEGSGFLHDPEQEATLKPTGQNLVWFAGEQFVRGALTGSPRDVAASVHSIEQACGLTTDEGIQPDHSFHQHGPQLYVGGYGLQFLKDAITYARLTDGTRFAFAPDTVKVLADYLLDGAGVMVRGPMLDYGAIGREISRPGGGKEAVGLIAICDSLSAIRQDLKTNCDSLKSNITSNGQTANFVGNRYFWNSDFMVHERNAYYSSVKMASNRTYGTEKVNNENLKGYWIPFGTNYIARRGDEYLDIFPAWNWAHLPGVTCPDEVPEFLSHVDQKNWFSGGVSDGMYGAAAVQVDLPAAPSLHAHKSWFFFDREYVALGAGISSTDSPAMNTTLNQTLHQGDILVDGNPLPAGEKMLSGVTWVLHDGIGYVFPQKTAVYVSSGTHTGNWGQINALQSNTPVTKDIFTLWMSSGSRPVNATYAYAVVPNIDSAALASYATKLPFRILANTTSIQAVRQMQLGISESIFYSPGQLTIRDGLTVSVDQPCMMLLEESPGHPAKLTVSTPRGPLEIHVKFVTGRDQKDVTIEVRGGAASGASHIQSVDLQ
jgi:hypothetical protein